MRFLPVIGHFLITIGLSNCFIRHMGHEEWVFAKGWKQMHHGSPALMS